MIESFFRSLEAEGVAYLLISGQAAVLYGASTFSEDIDLWIDPGPDNADALVRALAACGARYYKLTPPLSGEFLREGHGFHFLIPDDPEVFLDVMGCPPRVGSFADARRRARTLATPWGDLPVVGIRDLVALKTTQRMADYPVIDRLVLRELETCRPLSEDDLGWAAEHLYTQEGWDEAMTVAPDLAGRPDPDSALGRYVRTASSGEEAPREVRDGAERELWEKMQAARDADRTHWKNIIDQLRELRRQGLLVPEGTPVAPPGGRPDG